MIETIYVDTEKFVSFLEVARKVSGIIPSNTTAYFYLNEATWVKLVPKGQLPRVKYFKGNSCLTINLILKPGLADGVVEVKGTPDAVQTQPGVYKESPADKFDRLISTPAPLPSPFWGDRFNPFGPYGPGVYTNLNVAYSTSTGKNTE